MRIVLTGILYSFVYLLHGQNQGIVSDTGKNKFIVSNYLEALLSKQSPPYFYTLYADNKLKNLNESDSSLIHKFLFYPNNFSQQRSLFLTDYRQLRGLRSRQNSIIIHGYLASTSYVNRNYQEMRLWQGQQQIQVKIEVPKEIMPYYSTSIYYGVKPSFNMRTTTYIPYSSWVNRYNRIYEMMENDRGRR